MFKYLKNINVEEIKIPSKDRNYEAKQVKEGLYFFKDSKENLHFGIKVDSQEKISDPIFIIVLANSVNFFPIIISASSF